MFCKHNWKLLSETTTQSRASHQADLIRKVSDPSNIYQHKELYGRKLIQTFTCSKCGKFKRFVEEV